MHPEYMTRIIPESLRQRTAANFFQDLWLFERPWSFNLADLPAHVQESIHIWHGTGDKQVRAFSFSLISLGIPQVKRTCGCLSAPGPSTWPVWPLPACNPSTYGTEQETSRSATPTVNSSTSELASWHAHHRMIMHLPAKRADLLVMF